MKCSDTSITNIIFYDDGTYLSNFSGERFHLNGKEYLKSVVQGNDQDKFYTMLYWGAYRINGDTITAQYVNNIGGSWAAGWIAGEIRYHILDKNRIALIQGSSRSFLKLTKWEEEKLRNNPTNLTRTPQAKFIQCDTIPLPNCWLKKEPWIQCN